MHTMSASISWAAILVHTYIAVARGPCRTGLASGPCHVICWCPTAVSRVVRVCSGKVVFPGPSMQSPFPDPSLADPFGAPAEPTHGTPGGGGTSTRQLTPHGYIHMHGLAQATQASAHLATALGHLFAHMELPAGVRHTKSGPNKGCAVTIRKQRRNFLFVANKDVEMCRKTAGYFHEWVEDAMAELATLSVGQRRAR